jgi:hypothetical protein
MYAWWGFSFVALETYNVVSSAASSISTTPHVNRFSTNQALSNGYFHDYLSVDVFAQRQASAARVNCKRLRLLRGNSW